MKYPLFSSHLTKLDFLDRFSKKIVNTNFHENPFSGSQGVSCGGKDRKRDGQTDGRMDRHDKVKSLFAISTACFSP